MLCLRVFMCILYAQDWCPGQQHAVQITLTFAKVQVQVFIGYYCQVTLSIFAVSKNE